MSKPDYIPCPDCLGNGAIPAHWKVKPPSAVDPNQTGSKEYVQPSICKICHGEGLVKPGFRADILIKQMTEGEQGAREGKKD